MTNNPGDVEEASYLTFAIRSNLDKDLKKTFPTKQETYLAEKYLPPLKAQDIFTQESQTEHLPKKKLCVHCTTPKRCLGPSYRLRDNGMLLLLETTGLCNGAIAETLTMLLDSLAGKQSGIKFTLKLETPGVMTGEVRLEDLVPKKVTLSLHTYVTF